MARSPRFLATALALLLLALVARPLAAADDKDLKKARTDLKANKTALQQADSFEGVNKDAQAKALDLVPKVRAAENEDAVSFLLWLATQTAHQETFEKIRDEVASLSHDDAIKQLVNVLAKKDKKADWQQRALAAEVSAKIGNAKIVDGLLEALKDNDPNVLNPAIISCGKKEEKRVVAGLVDVLKRVEKAGGWEYRHARQSLVDLTGQDFFTFETWKKWWDSNKDSFEFGKKGEAKEAKTQERAPNEKKPTFFETEVKSNRFCFVIDVSGSMKMCDVLDNPDDPTAVSKAAETDPTDEFLKAHARIERAKAELRKAIANLDPSVRFNLLSFSDKAHLQTCWPDVQQANEPTKKAALAWVDALKADGGTYTDDALARTFQMSDIDTIYFLSDGAPEKPATGKESIEENQRKLMQVCYGLIDKERRFRKITIHTFGLCGLGIWFKKWGTRPQGLSLDPKSVEPLREFMKKVAEMTGGEFKQI